LNWRNKTSGGQTIKYPDQWHAAVVPSEESTEARILAVYQIKAGEGASIDAPTRETGGAIRVANWRVTATLEPSQPASLLIERTDGGAALAVDYPAVRVGGTSHKSSESESLLIEQADRIVRRCGDQVPIAAR
jgi:hypothetical protein